MTTPTNAARKLIIFLSAKVDQKCNVKFDIHAFWGPSSSSALMHECTLSLGFIGRSVAPHKKQKRAGE